MNIEKYRYIYSTSNLLLYNKEKLGTIGYNNRIRCIRIYKHRFFSVFFFQVRGYLIMQLITLDMLFKHYEEI